MLLTSNTSILSYSLPMKKITVLMAAVLAITTLLTAGLTVLPSSVQDAQANPCANNNVNQPSVSGDQKEVDSDIECEFYGPVDIEEGLQ
jgi:hypothetical protein